MSKNHQRNNILVILTDGISKSVIADFSLEFIEFLDHSLDESFD